MAQLEEPHLFSWEAEGHVWVPCLDPSPAPGQFPKTGHVLHPHGVPWGPPMVPGLEAATGNSTIRGCSQVRASRAPHSPVPVCSAGPGPNGRSERNMSPVGTGTWGLVPQRTGDKAWTPKAPRPRAPQGRPQRGSTPPVGAVGPARRTLELWAGPDWVPGSFRRRLHRPEL